MAFSTSNMKDNANELVINIVGDKDEFNAKIELENSFFQKQLLNKHLCLTYAQLDNTAVPLFIPKKLNSIPSYVLVPNLIPQYNSININSLDYIMAVNTTDDLSTAKYAIPKWNPVDPNAKPPSTLPTQRQVYNNNYYWSYTVTHILKHFENMLIDLLKTLIAPAEAEKTKIVFNGKNISIVIPDLTPPTDIYIWVNSELRELLQVNNFKDPQNENLFRLVHDTQKNVNGSDAFIFSSRFISRQWNAFDTVLITTSLPLKSVEYQTNVENTSETSTQYRSVLFSLNMVSAGVNFYPYFVYEPESTDIFKSFSQNSYTKSTYDVEVFLYNKRNGLSIPYKLNKNGLISLDFLIKEIGNDYGFSG